MKISTRTRYGVRTMLEIARAKEPVGVYQKDIAINQNLSLKYLDHIIHALKTARLIANARGRKSGYVLTRSPGEITIYDIHRAFESGICVVDCIGKDFKCDYSGQCLTQGFWRNLNNIILTYFRSVTLKDIIDGKEDFPEES
jgi:Rrf2 family protein